ncbi:UNVERIFIED_CONTAM: hypothetical protein K2H54_046427 [Gekko kuhli]
MRGLKKGKSIVKSLVSPPLPSYACIAFCLLKSIRFPPSSSLWSASKLCVYICIERVFQFSYARKIKKNSSPIKYRQCSEIDLFPPTLIPCRTPRLCIGCSVVCHFIHEALSSKGKQYKQDSLFSFVVRLSHWDMS